MKNLYAYTVPGANYPAYLSVNGDPHGNVTITVRSTALEHGVCGPTAEITLTPEQVNTLVASLIKNPA